MFYLCIFTKYKQFPLVSWELGYFDGKSGNAFVMPIVDSESDGYTGVEYVCLYHKIVELPAKNGNMNLYVSFPEEKKYLGSIISESV